MAHFAFTIYIGQLDETHHRFKSLIEMHVSSTIITTTAAAIQRKLRSRKAVNVVGDDEVCVLQR